jgi:hypothetical protein
MVKCSKAEDRRYVAIVEDEATGERILGIEVRGKRGVGYCKSMPSAVRSYERLLNRAKPIARERRRERQRRRREGGEETCAFAKKAKLPEPTDPVFPGNHIKLFNRFSTGPGSSLIATETIASLIACAIPISVCVSWKALTSTRLQRIDA